MCWRDNFNKINKHVVLNKHVGQKISKIVVKMLRKILETGIENFSNFEKTVLNELKMLKNYFYPI